MHFLSPFPFHRSAARAVALALLCVVLGNFSAARAQSGDVDPPGRVARLSEVIGRVWLYRPDGSEWLEATRNAPLTGGDRLATEPGARAELQIGSATLRLDSGGDLDIVALDDSRIAVQLQAGALAVRVRDAAETGPLDVQTSEGRFHLLRAGAYRVDRGNRSSFVSVDMGAVRYDYASSALTVEAGQRGEFWLDAGGAAQYALLAPVADGFTAWNNERDRGIDLATASRFVSPEMTGAADLVRYGNWEQTPDYGAVWVPTAVAADWAPYSAGRWAFVRPWGWTWVDDAPWGFAPFHYGRWVNVRNRWCWTPGARAPRPVYAPALVGWVGGGPQGGASVSIGVGPAVGWFPLAPREVYVPSYRTSPRYARDVNINITNVTNVTSITRVFNDPRAPREFENRRFPHAVTVVPAAVLSERRPVGPAAAQYRDAPWVREFAQRGGGSVALTAPPVGAPAVPPRQSEAGPVRPPFAAFQGNPRGRGASPERDPGRDFDRDRDHERDASRPGLPARALPSPAEPRTGGLDERGRGGFQGRGGLPSTPQPAPVQVQPSVQPPVQAAPQPMPNSPEPGGVRGGGFRPPTETVGRPPGLGNGGDGRAPGGLPSTPSRPGVAVEPQESPRMRTFPVRRGEDRREDGGRPDATMPAPRAPQIIAPPAVVQSPAVQAPALPAPPVQMPMRPVDAPRNPERPSMNRPPEAVSPARPDPVAPRPPEVQSPRREPAREAPAPRPVEVQRPAPPAEPRVSGPERRDPGASR